MGQKPSKSRNLSIEKRIFKSNSCEQIRYVTQSQKFLENSSNWAALLKEKLKVCSKTVWAKEVLKVLKNWENYGYYSSKAKFVWDNFKSSNNHFKIDQSKAYTRSESTPILQTFSHKLSIDPDKKTLHELLTEKRDCILYNIIRTFKNTIVKYYCTQKSDKFALRPKILKNINHFKKEVDKSIKDFISIIIRIIPLYFFDLPKELDDIDGIVRNAIISNEVLSMLVMFRKESFVEIQDKYLRGLESFGKLSIQSGILNKLEEDMNENYMKAMESLLNIPNSMSIGNMQDSVAMLMNYISMGLLDESNPFSVVEDEDLVKAFLLVIGKSSVPDLPLYLDILNQFLDDHTLSIKEVGQGIIKLTYIVDNSSKWPSFISFS
jgi:hypothetical protein